jgi:AP-2 complex subunit alpha
VASTRSLLLSTYIKWVNVFPEIKSQLINVFERYRHVLDAELQQRACEFYALASRSEDDEVLQNVCEEMPPFPPRTSALLERLNRKHGDTEDRRTWIHGGKEANTDRQTAQARKVSGMLVNGNASSDAARSEVDNIADSLMGLEIGATSPEHAMSTPNVATLPPALPSSSQPTPHLTSGPNVDRWFEKLTYNTDGVLYEDVQIQIGIKSKFQGHLGQLAVYLGNKISAPMTSFTTRIHEVDPDTLSVTLAKMPPNMIAPRTQTQLLLQVECRKTFTQPPVLEVSFLAGSHQTIAVRLPLMVTKFFEPVKFSQADFFERWKLIGGPPREAQAIFPITLNEAGQLDMHKHRQVVSGLCFNPLDGIDPNPSNIVGAAVLHTSLEGKVGCLLRLEPNKEAKVGLQYTPDVRLSS